MITGPHICKMKEAAKTLSKEHKNAGRTRLTFLDAFRGILVVNMVLYHFCWDLVFLKGVDWPWFRYYTTPARLWQTFIRFYFIFLSGYCLNMSKRSLRRGLELTACGALITAVTLLVMPEDAIIFGVLTFLGAATLIGSPVNAYYKGGKVQSAVLFMISLVFYVVLRGVSQGFIGIMSRPLLMLPESLYRGYFMTFLGFIAPGFSSTDYVPLLPWIFVYFMGFFLGKLTLPALRERMLARTSSGKAAETAAGRFFKPFVWIGQHALIIYMLHQPILAGITNILIYLDR